MNDIIPQKEIEDADNNRLPQAVTVMPQEVESPEEIPYLISFSDYKEKLCQISLLEKSEAVKAIGAIKTIGNKIYSEKDYQRISLGRKSVYNDGGYKRLYNGLSEEVEIFEHKISQSARIFFYNLEPKRTCYIVAIIKNHLETDKVRR
jgi:hypothetical protein